VKVSRKQISDQTIYVGIASYRDPMLFSTIQDASEKAHRPQNLRFGVVEQEVAQQRLKKAECGTPAPIRYLGIDPSESRGACWARALGMTLYENEDWYFQIDAHMLFEPGWDQKLIEETQRCMEHGPKVILSSYPNGFTIRAGKRVPIVTTCKVLGHALLPDQTMQMQDPLLSFSAVSVDSDVPVRGFHLAAGCLFTRGEFVRQVPYDPQIYFQGEEQTLAVRAFTHGWDIWHPAGLPIYHLYNVPNGKSRRATHWQDDGIEGRTVRWQELDARSRRRARELLYEERSEGAYGLGKDRTLSEYAEFSGLDYRRRTISRHAYAVRWSYLAPAKAGARMADDSSDPGARIPGSE
jgi:hypothetical protein